MRVVQLFLLHFFSWFISLVSATYIEVSNTDGEVKGITNDFGVFVIASEKTVFFYRDVGAKQANSDELLGFVNLPPENAIDTLLEFKLLAKDAALICDNRNCSLCIMSKRCTIFMKPKSFAQHPLTYVTAVGFNDKVYIRAINLKNKIWTAVYLLTDPGSYLNPVQAAIDNLTYVDTTGLSSSFTKNGYVYFIGSSKSIYEPNVFQNVDFDIVPNTGFLRLTRICTQDLTPILESRIDVVLTCDGLTKDNENMINYASYFDPIDDMLYTVSKNANSSDNFKICSFPYQQLQQRFDETWDVCQKTSFDDAERCNHRIDSDDDALPDHCYVFTVSNDESKRCVRFQGITNTSEKLDNCNLADYRSSAYRYGTLNDYRQLEGELLASLDSSSTKDIAQILPDKQNALFLANFGGSVFRTTLHKQGTTYPTWSRNNTTSGSKKMAYNFGTKMLYYGMPSKIVSVHVSCNEMFHACDDLLAGGYQDALNCGWCQSDDGKPTGEVMSVAEANECRTKLVVNVCPPVIQAISYDRSKKTWYILGKHMTSMKNPRILVCGRECLQRFNNSNSLECQYAGESHGEPEICDVEMEGLVGMSKSRVVRPKVRDDGTDTVRVSDDEASGDPNNSDSKGMSRVTKALIGIFSVIGIIIFLAIIIWYTRKTYMANKILVAQNRATGFGSALFSPSTFNVYDAHPSNNTGNMANEETYEDLFQTLNLKVRIDSKDLSRQTQIGEGHFGVVYKGVYTEPNDSQKQISVACKMLKQGVPGVREFFEEGLRMANFEHERVMRLIGIAFEGTCSTPIIVTEYMTNGDLYHYLKDKENKPTLRDLFRFGIQIAEGMEYLHSLNFIHRDLATRNCMLDRMLNIKISDFGLCRSAMSYGNVYEVLHKDRKLPIRWMPIEALRDTLFTLKGDVWSYGVTLWEMMTRGDYPYRGISGDIILEYLMEGQRLNQPMYCPAILYNNIMMPCWAEDPNLRPPFSALKILMKNVVQEMEKSKKQQMNAEYEQVTPISRISNSSSTNAQVADANVSSNPLPTENIPLPEIAPSKNNFLKV